MRYRNSYTSFALTSFVTLAVVFLLTAQYFHSGAKTDLEPAHQNEDPVAVVKSILVNGAEQTEVTPSEMKVTRVTAEVQGGQTGMLLVPGDEIGTGPNAKVTVLFLDAAPEKDNEVLIDSNARMRVGSIFNLLGRVLVRSKGKFTAATQRVKLDEAGTEYELVVQPDGTNRIRVLDGALRVQQGSFSRLTTPDDLRRIDESIVADSGVKFLPTSFDTQIATRPRSAVSQSTRPGKMEFVAIRGRTTSFDRDFVFTNRCNLKHQYEIRGPRHLTWFRIMGANIFELDGRESSSISFAMRADATRIPVGVYEGEIIARCLDCAQEQGCDVGGLNLDISVSVVDPGGAPVEERGRESATTPGREPATTPRGEPAAAPGSEPATIPSREPPSLRRPVSPSPQVRLPIDQTSTLAQELQQVILGPDGVLNKTPASVGEIDETLNWSNEVIVRSQPTYSAQSIIPHLQSWQERAEQFRVARRGAILKNDPNSYEALGRIYVDWGNGAKAVDELNKAVAASQTAERMTSLGEAYRLIGDLRRSQGVLGRTVRLYPDYAPGLNALGNVYFDQAKIEQDQKDYESARTALNVARQHYERAKTYSPALIVAESNIAETELTLGDIAREQGQLDEAMNQYKQAEETFSRVEQTSRSYVFATKGLGDVYRGMTSIARSQGDTTSASATYARSLNKYRQALQSHRDASEAYIGLGRLYEDNGLRDDAVNAYGQAIRARPEVSQGYYYYATAVYYKNPGSAAAYAKAYLKLEREVFKQGTKAANARQVVEHRWVPPTIHTPPVTPPTTPTGPLTPTDPPTGNWTPVKVPDVYGKKPDEALKKLREKGLDGQIREEADCKASGKVAYTSPKKDDKVRPGTMVTMYVSTAGENAVTVPSVTRQSLSEAQRELQSLDLVADVRSRRENDSVPENTVLEQKPAGGRIKAGCKVELIVSTSYPVVPSYIGMTQQAAFQRLSTWFGTFLRGNVIPVDKDGPAGIVVNQDPQPGERRPSGTRINLYISRASSGGDDVGDDVGQPVYDAVVPELYGQTLQQAKSTLERHYLRLGTVNYRNLQSSQPGLRFVGQNVKPGVGVTREAAVEINYNHAQSSQLPQRIQRIQRIQRPPPQRGDPRVNTVVDQNPRPGARLRRGSPVNIWIGVYVVGD